MEFATTWFAVQLMQLQMPKLLLSKGTIIITIIADHVPDIVAIITRNTVRSPIFALRMGGENTKRPKQAQEGAKKAENVYFADSLFWAFCQPPYN